MFRRNRSPFKSHIKYRAGYKYQLVEDYPLENEPPIILPWHPPKDIITEYIQFFRDGRFVIKKGYAWDGASGGARDTKTIMRGALTHDALYQLMREGHLDMDLYRALADWALWQTCREDRMWFLRAWWVHEGVRWGGGPSANPRNDRPILTAP
ncbi:MAG: hypothetical protein ABFD60_07745 [Bryobacteraceae bacterium]